MTDNPLIRCMTSLVTEPWLLTPAMHKVLCDIVEAHMHDAQSQHNVAAAMSANPAPRQYDIADNGVAVIPIKGVIGRKFSSSLYSSGVTSVDVLARMVDKAAADPAVNGMVLSVDSPGGAVQGIAECANAIQRARESKRVIAYADGQMASAAYWLGCQADAVYAWNEAIVGSIGVYSAFLDTSRAAAMQGVETMIFKSGKHKAMGHPGTSLTDEQRAMIQARVDEIGAKFRAAVRTGRARDIADEVMQGQAFTAQECLGNGLIDSICTLDEAKRDAGVRK